MSARLLPGFPWPIRPATPQDLTACGANVIPMLPGRRYTRRARRPGPNRTARTLQ